MFSQLLLACHNPGTNGKCWVFIKRVTLKFMDSILIIYFLEKWNLKVRFFVAINYWIESIVEFQIEEEKAKNLGQHKISTKKF